MCAQQDPEEMPTARALWFFQVSCSSLCDQKRLQVWVTLEPKLPEAASDTIGPATPGVVWTSSLCITWIPLDQNLHFNQIPRWFGCILHFWKHHPKRPYHTCLVQSRWSSGWGCSGNPEPIITSLKKPLFPSIHEHWCENKDNQERVSFQPATLPLPQGPSPVTEGQGPLPALMNEKQEKKLMEEGVNSSHKYILFFTKIKTEKKIS